MSERPSKDELRQAIPGRVDTFTNSVEWIGGSAEIAFADSVIALADWLARTTTPETERFGHDCEHMSLQHGADGCNVPGCLCAFMSWCEKDYR